MRDSGDSEMEMDCVQRLGIRIVLHKTGAKQKPSESVNSAGLCTVRAARTFFLSNLVIYHCNLVTASCARSC